MRKKLFFASGNKGKYQELVGFFEAQDIELVMDENMPDIEENEPTLLLNAIHKAKEGAKYSGMWTLGEDTGFYVRALDYFPGMHAKRWMDGTWPEKAQAVLDMMKEEQDRTCYLINRFALVDPTGEMVFTFKVKNTYEMGYEAHIRPGHETFGYNTILTMNGYYIGDLTNDERNFLKHRGRIAKEVREKMDFFRSSDPE